MIYLLDKNIKNVVLHFYAYYILFTIITYIYLEWISN